jgi:hypothetical protein
MSTTPITANPGCMALEAVTTLRVISLHDGCMGAEHACEAAKAIALAGGSRTAVQCMSWGFDMLSRLDLRHASIREASQVDVLIASTFACEPLPDHVRSWVTACLRTNGRGMPVIVALHHEQPARSQSRSSLCEFLSSIAARRQSDFLCNEAFDLRLGQGLVSQLVERRRRLDGREADVHPAGAAECGARWGINE